MLAKFGDFFVEESEEEFTEEKVMYYMHPYL